MYTLLYVCYVYVYYYLIYQDLTIDKFILLLKLSFQSPFEIYTSSCERGSNQIILSTNFTTVLQTLSYFPMNSNSVPLGRDPEPDDRHRATTIEPNR